MLQKIKSDLIKARRIKDTRTINILSLIISEYELAVYRNPKTSLDQVIKAVIKNNEETLKHKHDQILINENLLLQNYLPLYLTKSEIQDHLKKMDLPTDNFGKMMGKAMSYFKNGGFDVEPTSVKEVLESLFQDA